MKAKGFLILAVACFVLVALAVLKEGARSEDPAPNPALYGITYVEGVATNYVYVQFSIQHGGYYYTYSYHDQGDGNYLVGRSSNWGDWCVWATYTRNDSSFLACVDGERQQSNPHPDEVALYLVYSSGGCACWPQEEED